MEKRKLTKEDLDKVRNIEGFPIGSDEDIIALSDAPYYTACPNPFIKEFIEENGHPYDEKTDDYHREPFASDVSEGKSDPIYNVHSYHTKVPHKAVMRYIMHYTNPGDIVYDGFCGSGMTGVAAQLCGDRNSVLDLGLPYKNIEAKIGPRKAVLSDLATAATFTALNYNYSVDVNELKDAWTRISKKCESECSWLFETKHVDHDAQMSIPIGSNIGRINYSIWSDKMICPHCGHEFVFWDVAVDEEQGKVKDSFHCPECNSILTKKNCDKATRTYVDEATNEIVSVVDQVPVLINYTYAGKKYDKKPDDFDLDLIQKLEKTPIKYWYPTDKMMHIGEKWGDSYRAGYHYGITRVHQFFTKRNLFVISLIVDSARHENPAICNCILSAVKSSFSYGTRMIKVNVGRILNGGGLFALGAVSGTLYIPSLMAERNIFDAIDNKIAGIIKMYSRYSLGKDVFINTGSSSDICNMPNNSIDYIFTDPPFGDNLNYSELNFIWEAWQKVFTNNLDEAIINKSQHKGILEYQELMAGCFQENFRILKPGRWMTVEFHNSKNNVWNAIQEALMRAGFVIADVRTLDKKQGSFKQVTNTTSVKQDLIISVYKPRDDFAHDFMLKAGSEEAMWEFIRQHLDKLPVAPDGDNNGKIDIVSERQGYLLYDRMVSWHVVHGVAVPMDAADFYQGLDEHFLKRDDMYFLPDQVNEYDQKRAYMELENVQLSFAIQDEKGAIQWLNYQLSEPQTYQELQPKYLQELHQLRSEKMPELMDLLKENFLEDENGKWYVPDITKAGDVAKLREKSLIKEFESYLQSKGKLKVFRSEAIRAGFSKLWKEKDYKNIVAVAERLPEQVVQEDPNLLMYYDISLSRV